MKDWLDEEIAREGLKHNRSERSRQREERFLNSGNERLFGASRADDLHHDSDDARALRVEHRQEHAKEEQKGHLFDAKQAKKQEKARKYEEMKQKFDKMKEARQSEEEKEPQASEETKAAQKYEELKRKFDERKEGKGPDDGKKKNKIVSSLVTVLVWGFLLLCFLSDFMEN